MSHNSAFAFFFINFLCFCNFDGFLHFRSNVGIFTTMEIFTSLSSGFFLENLFFIIDRKGVNWLSFSRRWSIFQVLLCDVSERFFRYVLLDYINLYVSDGLSTIRPHLKHQITYQTSPVTYHVRLEDPTNLSQVSLYLLHPQEVGSWA
jgi:hypothetical protein